MDKIVMSGQANNSYYAHSLEGKPTEEWQLLEDHLRGVAELAHDYASFFDAKELAEIAGLFHDLGKYADQFQRRLRNSSQEKGKDHWSAGAALMLGCYKHLGEMAALCVEGHHIGLQQIKPYREWLNDIGEIINDPELSSRFTETNFKLLLERFQDDNLIIPKIKNKYVDFRLHDMAFAASAMLDVRMLFSALVDADFIDTEEAFGRMKGESHLHRPVGPDIDVNKCITKFNDYMKKIRKESQANTEINRARDQLMQSCLGASKNPVGLFTLTAPTGCGKTLSMLAFALHHAKQNNLRRIILVMPFLNIIEQTLGKYVELFREEDGFPTKFIIEDHSLAYNQNEDDLTYHERDIFRIKKLLAENWDAPIILTTNVKCLESLMSNKPSSCRKLHRLAKSVVLFDEVQTLPPRLVVPTLATLSRLADPNGPYKSTVVFSTATQPAFNHLDEHIKKLNPVGWKPKEIVSDFKTLFTVTSKRSSIQWRFAEPVDMSDLAEVLLSHEQAMCIVNLKRHASELATILKSRENNNLYHLSTNMCQAHRKEVLKKVTSCLRKNDPVLLISTQCIEAGVDIDFPNVYRALAPLDSLAQAAGRCNRHGSRPEKGNVVIFRFKSDGKVVFPPGYSEGVQATEIFLNHLKIVNPALDEMEIINDPELLQRYYCQFYDLTGRGAGEIQDERELWRAIEEGDFVKVAQAYQLIKADQINILVPYEEKEFKKLIEEAIEKGLYDFKSIRKWKTAAKPLSVSIYRPKKDHPAWNYIIPIQFGVRKNKKIEDADWYYLSTQGKYDELIGLSFEDCNYYMV